MNKYKKCYQYKKIQKKNYLKIFYWISIVIKIEQIFITMILI